MTVRTTTRNQRQRQTTQRRRQRWVYCIRRQMATRDGWMGDRMVRVSKCAPKNIIIVPGGVTEGGEGGAAEEIKGRVYN